jgi:hypothetical protein
MLWVWRVWVQLKRIARYLQSQWHTHHDFNDYQALQKVLWLLSEVEEHEEAGSLV